MYEVRTGMETLKFKTRQAAQDYIDDVDQFGLFCWQITRATGDGTSAKDVRGKQRITDALQNERLHITL